MERESHKRQADTGSSISFLTGKGWVEGGGFPVGATVGFLTLDPARGLPAGTGCPGKFCMKGFHKQNVGILSAAGSPETDKTRGWKG